MKNSKVKNGEIKEMSTLIKAPLAPKWVLLIAIMLPGVSRRVRQAMALPVRLRMRSRLRPVIRSPLRN